MQPLLMPTHKSDPEQLCMELLRADTEDQVIAVLNGVGLWDNPDAWRPYGDTEGNFATAGNQQSASTAALVEKIVNSIDAVLMRECMIHGIDPESTEAPQSIPQAVAWFFGGDPKKESTLGHIGAWDSAKRTEVSKKITLAATGDRRNPSFTIVDQGEGQHPDDFPTTLLSLDRQNKMRIPFVQGKFNMGGTGALRFCGYHNIQLIVSKRSTGATSADGFPPDWGFTVVRRDDPNQDRRLSTYTYLAPLEAETKPKRGDVLRFSKPSLSLMPDGNRPYVREIEAGTAIKLYEYETTGFRSHILRRGGLLQRLELLMPEPALPLRLHECRNFEGHEGSFDTTLEGLLVRLEDNRADNIEEGFPSSAFLRIAGEAMTARIYAFRPSRSQTYRKAEGVVFSLNGQTHGHFDEKFFSRRAVGMDRLAKDILVVVDCSDMQGRYREDLFMNSRDRLSDIGLRTNIEAELATIIKSHDGLKALRERRKREEIKKIEDDDSLQAVLEAVIQMSPAFAALFGIGSSVANPFRLVEAGGGTEFTGRRFPTYFSVRGSKPGQLFRKECPINSRFRVPFETDAENEYFERQADPGRFSLRLNGRNEVRDHSLNLVDGVANLRVSLPDGVSEGDRLEYIAEIGDDSRPVPIENSFVVQVIAPRKPHSGGKSRNPRGKGSDGLSREMPSLLSLPRVVLLRRRDWQEHGFDKLSTLKIVHEGDDEVAPRMSPYTFYINMDNQYLEMELKQRRGDGRAVQKRWEWGLVLIGLGLIRHHSSEETKSDEDEQPLGEFVDRCSRALAPIVIPLIESIATIDIEEIATDDDEDLIRSDDDEEKYSDIEAVERTE